MSEIQVGVRLDDGAFMPTRGHAADAGLDLRTKEFVTVYGNSSAVIDTGVHLIIPEGWCGLIVSKSGLNVNEGITVTGLIDANFTGPIRVRVYNDLVDNYVFNEGAKVAQVMFIEVPKVTLVLDEVQEHDLRGDNGYGSTGR